MRARLLRDAYPRVQMFILVALTGLGGFGASAGMLAAGIETMSLRYLLAMGIAYIAASTAVAPAPISMSDRRKTVSAPLSKNRSRPSDMPRKAQFRSP